MDKTRHHLAAPTPRGVPHPEVELSCIGGYRLLRWLGEGGMGSVYLGYKEGQGLPVAIKVLGDHLVRSPGFVDRFQREFLNGALLDHPHIVRCYERGQDPVTGKHFLVLEFVDGPSAQALLDRRGVLPVGDAAHVVLGIARALEHAHSRHIIHRDIKPDNILLTRTGVAKLADLGLAKKVDEASHLTAARQGFGTTPYMPYEQAINARYADARSDIYALGATFYHLVTGVLPFTGGNDLEVIEKKRLGEFVPARKVNPTLPASLDAILARMLACEPGDRYPSAGALIADLEHGGLAAAVPNLVEASQPAADLMGPTAVAANAPTRLSLEVPASPSPASEREGRWYLRYRKPDGRICNGRATTGQILHRLRDGRLPTEVEARRRGQDCFHPLDFFPEFQGLLTTAPSARSLIHGDRPVQASLRPWFLLAAAGSLLLGFLAGLLALSCLHWPPG
jgi:serine/threonine-protein kinase